SSIGVRFRGYASQNPFQTIMFMPAIRQNQRYKMKCVWIINQYASTPEVGFGGRSFYLAKELANLGVKVYLIASSANHLLYKKVHLEEKFGIECYEGVNIVWV